MATSINPDGSTNGVSGKVSASTKASALATTAATSFVMYSDTVHQVHEFYMKFPFLPALLVAGLVAFFTWLAGYVAKHAPAGVVDVAKAAWSTAVNDENLIPSRVGSISSDKE